MKATVIDQNRVQSGIWGIRYIWRLVEQFIQAVGSQITKQVLVINNDFTRVLNSSDNNILNREEAEISTKQNKLHAFKSHQVCKNNDYGDSASSWTKINFLQTTTGHEKTK